MRGHADKHQAVDKLEYKSTPLEVKDLDRSKRTAVIAFATYNNVDRGGDILRPGAFKKSWNENKSDIRFFLNHDPSQAPGKGLDFFDDGDHANVKAYLGTHTLGEDTLKMMDEGIITDASFGFNTIQSNNIDVKGKSVRELKEVRQREFSVLTDWGMNPASKVLRVTKSLNGDAYKAISDRLAKLEKFCRNTTASDECIKNILQEVKSLQSIVSQFDTADTHDANEPTASGEGNTTVSDEIIATLKLLTLKAALS